MSSRFFQKSLTDLVRGIRANKKTEQKYINQQIQEIKTELKDINMDKKACAVLKLTYLHMLGYDMSWAAFNVIEVMSSAKFSHKRIGHLGAGQSFQQNTDVITLATAGLKRDFASSNVYEAAVAISCLANICTPDLARDLVSDVLALLNHSKPYLRKKSILVLYKVFLKFPDALRPAFPRLKTKLEDPEIAVVSAAVNVICELARKNPKNYLSLAPIFFKLLTITNNNWMLIKIVKLFGALTPHEPRLGKKLVAPLTNLINTTPAMSLLYECVNTCTIGLSDCIPIIKLCITKLKTFVEDPDQNLKYLGLLALSNIMKAHPKAVAEHRDLVLRCLADDDVTIRLRALDLIEGMVSKKSLVDIVRKLMEYVATAEGTYREDLICKIVTICSQDNYSFIRDFEWYISILVELTRIRGTRHGQLIASQLLDVAIRVSVIRSYAVRNMVNMILDPRFLQDNPNGKDSISEVLYAAAWIVGEFAKKLASDQMVRVLEAFLQPKVHSLPSRIQAVYLHNALKVFSEGYCRSTGSTPKKLVPDEDEDEYSDDMESDQVDRMQKILLDRLPTFTQSVHLEVQERACNVLELMKIAQMLRTTDQKALGANFAALFAEVLNPVAKKAQLKVPVPVGLNLDTWINEQPKEEVWEDDGGSWGFGGGFGTGLGSKGDFGDDDSSSGKGTVGGAPGGGGSAAAARNMDINILGGGKSKTPKVTDVDVSNIPIEPLVFETGASGRRKKHRGAEARVATVFEMPAGATDEKEANRNDDEKDALALALDIDISAPLRDDEILPVQTHRVAAPKPAAAAPATVAPIAAEPAVGKTGRRRKHRGGDAPAPAAAAPVAAAPAPTGPRPAAPPPSSGSLLDLLGDGPPLAPLNVAAPVPAPAAPARPDYEAVLSPPSRPLVMTAEAEPGAPAASAGGEDGHRRKRRRRGEEAAAPAAAPLAGVAAPAPAAPAPGPLSAGVELLSVADAGLSRDPRPVMKTLCQTPELLVQYSYSPSLSQPKQIGVPMTFVNNSSDRVVDIEVSVVDSMNMRLMKPVAGSASVKTGISLFPGVNQTVVLQFSFENFAFHQKLRGAVSYIVQGEHTTKKNQDFTLDFPCSAFITPIRLNLEEFRSIAGSPETILVSTKIRTSEPFNTVLAHEMSLLRCALVEAVGDAASFYGRSVHGHHVACLFKQVTPGVYSLDMKCSDRPLANNLIQEVNESKVAA